MHLLTDAAGLVGVALMLGAYAGAQIHRLDATRAPSLALNLAGACLVMISLTHDFNLSAFLMEAAWAAVAAWGLVRVALSRRGRPPA
ncbi:MAG TPA: hypothetical protein VFC47_04750 [Caulobacteraceae bacterium]|nr:hypothetical protein [Caulobacteraceae bacterium]